MIKKYTFLLLIAVGSLFAGCSKEDDVPGLPGSGKKDRTFFIYMMAENNLSPQFDYLNINTLLEAITPAHLMTNHVVIYHDPRLTSGDRPDTRPRLLDVVPGPNGKAVTREVRIYEEQNSATKEVLSSVIQEVSNRYESDFYNLVVWSHGSAWLPPGPDFSSRALGPDGKTWLDIQDFADAIPDGKFDYILFDACLMASAEVAYTLRNKTDWIIAAPTEVPGQGMVYAKMPDLLFGKNPDFKGYCDAYYDFYLDFEGGVYGSTISLIKTSEMENLAAVVKGILADVSMEEIYAVPTHSMQHFNRVSSAYPVNTFFDLEEYMEKVAVPSQLEELREAIDRAVAYQRFTERFLSITIKRNCGLTSYIPRGFLGKINEYYQTLDWYRAVY